MGAMKRNLAWPADSCRRRASKHRSNPRLPARRVRCEAHGVPLRPAGDVCNVGPQHLNAPSRSSSYGSANTSGRNTQWRAKRELSIAEDEARALRQIQRGLTLSSLSTAFRKASKSLAAALDNSNSLANNSSAF
jgi:hypothetical protein